MAEIRVARAAVTSYTQARYNCRDGGGYNPQIRDSVQFSPEAIEMLRQSRQAEENRENAERQATQGINAQQGLDILSLKSDASPDEVRRAYLLAINRYHPDRFANLPPEFQKLAEEKTKQINQAYQMLKNV